MTITDKISKLMLASAALVLALAALLFVLRSEPAHAEGSGGVGRYQWFSIYDPLGKAFNHYIMDTSDGFVWSNTAGSWAPAEKNWIFSPRRSTIAPTPSRR